MPNKELSYINYNGETYQIVDETAETKFSPLGHHHRVLSPCFRNRPEWLYRTQVQLNTFHGFWLYHPSPP